MSRVHWLGAGLSSGPGIRLVAASGERLVLWNRTLDRAHRALEGAGGSNVEVRPFAIDSWKQTLRSGDIVVSMLPANMHPQIAATSVEAGCHLVTTSYLSDPVLRLHEEAKEKGLSLLNECGLDPGIDHLLAHELVGRLRDASTSWKEGCNDIGLSFRSYCGGFPRLAGPFRYRFSWSPFGVLLALQTPARYISGREIRAPQCPWKDLSKLHCFDETFEVYPNRDSIPYVAEYGFDPSWRIDDFVRGTIRLAGWSEAWKTIFEVLETAARPQVERLSDELWREHRYAENEEDRVVLHVALEARRDGRTVWSQALALDEGGAARDTAMGRLVSFTATLALDSIRCERSPKGVSGAPRDRAEVRRWLQTLQQLGIRFVDHEDETAEFA